MHIPCIYQLSPEVQGRWLDALLARRAARVLLPSGAPLERSYLVQKEHLTLTLTLTLPLHLHLLLPLPLPLTRCVLPHCFHHVCHGCLTKLCGEDGTRFHCPLCRTRQPQPQP